MGAPLVIGPGGTMYFQQVYSSSAFPGLAQQGGGWITALTFPQDPSATAKLEALRVDLQVILSTTPNAPDGLSTTFSQNLGGNTTLVFPRQIFDVTLPNGGAPLTIPLQTPFYYNASAGQNLLLDIRNYGAIYGVGGIGSAAFDAQTTFGDAVSVVRSFGVNSTTGVANTSGLVTTFTFSPIPEPSPPRVAGCGLVVFGLLTLLKKVIYSRRLEAKARANREAKCL